MSEAGIPNTASTAPPSGRSFVERLLGVLRLDAAAYEDVASDPAALGQAAVVAAAAAIGGAIGTEWGLFSGQGLVFMCLLFALWPISAILVFALARWFGHTTDLMRVARLMGFARAPYVLLALAAIPIESVRVAVLFGSTALLLAIFVVAVRHALHTTTGRAAFVGGVTLLIVGFAWFVYVYLTA